LFFPEAAALIDDPVVVIVLPVVVVVAVAAAGPTIELLLPVRVPIQKPDIIVLNPPPPFAPAA